jgi:hypothetical protein
VAWRRERGLLRAQLPEHDRHAHEQRGRNHAPAEHPEIDRHHAFDIDSSTLLLKPRAAPRRPGGAPQIAQAATMPSPPAAFGTVIDPIEVSDPFGFTLNSSTMPDAPVCTYR